MAACLIAYFGVLFVWALARCTDAAAQRAQMSVIILLSEIDVFDVHITYFGVSFPVLCVWWCVVAAEEPTLRNL